MTNEPANRAPIALIAEDDRDIRELVTAKLGGAGYQVVAVGDGHAALAAAREQRPDVALLDVMMPGISGLDILRQLQDDPQTSSIPVILLTARSQEFDVQTGFSIGAADYVIKPFSPRELVARVDAVVGRTSV